MTMAAFLLVFIAGICVGMIIVAVPIILKKECLHDDRGGDDHHSRDRRRAI